MASKLNLEIKVGILVFMGLVILVLAVFSIGEIYLLRPGYMIKVIFDFASAIDLGAPVRVAGIEAGEVKDIELIYEQKSGKAKIVMHVWLGQHIKIPRDSVAFVNMLGLIGESSLEIIPGEDYKNLVSENGILIGREPLSTESMTEIMYKFSSNFDEIMEMLDQVLDEEGKSALKQIVYNVRDASASLKVISGRLERGEGKLGKWLRPKKSRRKKRLVN